MSPQERHDLHVVIMWIAIAVILAFTAGYIFGVTWTTIRLGGQVL